MATQREYNIQRKSTPMLHESVLKKDWTTRRNLFEDNESEEVIRAVRKNI